MLRSSICQEYWREYLDPLSTFVAQCTGCVLYKGWHMYLSLHSLIAIMLKRLECALRIVEQ